MRSDLMYWQMSQHGNVCIQFALLLRICLEGISHTVPYFLQWKIFQAHKGDMRQRIRAIRPYHNLRRNVQEGIRSLMRRSLLAGKDQYQEGHQHK
jgi:hypothetical protein